MVQMQYGPFGLKLDMVRPWQVLWDVDTQVLKTALQVYVLSKQLLHGWANVCKYIFFTQYHSCSLYLHTKMFSCDSKLIHAAGGPGWGTVPETLLHLSWSQMNVSSVHRVTGRPSTYCIMYPTVVCLKCFLLGLVPVKAKSIVFQAHAPVGSAVALKYETPWPGPNCPLIKSTHSQRGGWGGHHMCNWGCLSKCCVCSSLIN